MTPARRPAISIQTALSVSSQDDEHNSTDEEDQRDDFIHNDSFNKFVDFYPCGFAIFVAAPLQGFSPGDESEQDHDDGNHEEDMNEAADSVGSHQP